METSQIYLIVGVLGFIGVLITYKMTYLLKLIQSLFENSTSNLVIRTVLSSVFSSNKLFALLVMGFNSKNFPCRGTVN